MLNGILVDLRFATRRLLATPMFTAFAVLSLAVGTSVTTAAYSIVNSIFLNNDLGFPDPDRIAFVVNPYDGRFLKGYISQPDFEDLRSAQTSFTSMAASETFQGTVVTPSSTNLATTEAVDGSYFSTVGVDGLIGRVLQQQDDDTGAHVVVLSERFWHARFRSSTSAIGQKIRLSGQTFDVIGVAPHAFDGAAGGPPGTDLWIPLSAKPSLTAATNPIPATSAMSRPARVPREQPSLLVFGRLAPSATDTSASAEVATIAARLDATYPPSGRQGLGVSERPWKVRSIVAITKDDNLARRTGLTIVALVSLVLLVACTNLANLVLSRGTSRRQEFAVRSALGASRWRLVREQCAESLLIAAAGGAAAWLMFQGLHALLTTDISLVLPMGGQWTIAIEPTLNAGALSMAGISLLLSLVVFGLEPAIQLTKSTDLRSELAAGGGNVGDLKASRQRVLLRWQVAISAGFFLIATMFLRFTVIEAWHDSGIEMDRLAVATLNTQAPEWNAQRASRSIDRVVDQTQGDAILQDVAASTGLPFGAGSQQMALSLPEDHGSRDAFRATGIAATPSIFRTLGIPILRGRSFDQRDDAAAAPVVVVSEYTARRVMGTVDAVGRQLIIQRQAPTTATVIGVARDTDVRSILGDPAPFIYVPLAQRPEPPTTVVGRAQDAATAVTGLGDALRRADPDMAINVIGTARSVLASVFQLLRSAGLSSIALGGITLLLAMVGLFGIQAHIVSRRTREIGVRMSFGATPRQIERMVLRDGYRPVIEGLALGLFIGLAGRAMVRSYMELDISIVDPWTLIVVPIPLVLAAFCACYLPARRAASVDPSVALRTL